MAKLKENTMIGDELLFSYIYPVGSIFQTTDGNFNPAENWGGEWEKIEGRFLLGTTSSRTSKLTGGEETHTLRTDEIPAHSHTLSSNAQAHSFCWGNSWGANIRIANANAYAGAPQSNEIGTLQGSWNKTVNSGGGQSHNNMPPYYTVHIWHRIS